MDHDERYKSDGYGKYRSDFTQDPSRPSTGANYAVNWIPNGSFPSLYQPITTSTSGGKFLMADPSNAGFYKKGTVKLMPPSYVNPIDPVVRGSY